MTSIRKDLTLRLLAVTLLLAATAGAFLFGFVRSRLLAGFDAGMLAQARSISASVVRTREGRLELDYATTGNSEDGAAAYFEILRQDGSVFRRSSALSEADLPNVTAASGAPQFQDVTLHGGSLFRTVAFRFRPQPDPDDEPATDRPAAHPPAVPELTIVLASDRGRLDSTIRVLGSSLLLTALGLCVGTALAVIWAVRRGLRPLVRLADEADHIRGDSLHQRFSSDGLPAELRPISQRLNELLSRLQAAFERQRRFTADAAHELRTPIAELRSLTEVALRWPEDGSPSQTYRDALDIARHMESLVAALLDLARCDAGARRARLAAIDLAELIREAWRPNEQAASDRGLQVCFDLGGEPLVRSDRAMLMGIVSNLLGNAALYAPPGGRIECRVRRTGDRVELSISNTCQGLRPADLPYLFEPFWRKDAARSGGTHVGLGLSLVAAYARVLGAQLRVDLSPAADVFRIDVSLPAEPSDPTDNAISPEHPADALAQRDQ